MPWCEACDSYLTPTSMGSDGACPQCGAMVEPEPDADHEPPKTPWHFWVGVVAAGGYLVWRAFEGVLLLF